MRHFLSTSLLLLPALAWAAPPYTPKFARVAEQAEVLSWELCQRPSYPRASARNEETGVVTLRFTIAPSGHVVASAVARSSGFERLDNAAHAALARCRFKPASIDGAAVQSTFDVQYVWTLE